MTITQGGTPWAPPAGAAWTVRFGATNMPAGWYDTITEPDGGTHPAIVVDENTATVEIAEQAVSTPGNNVLCVLVTDAQGYQIASWPFALNVQGVPGFDAPEATVYYNALTAQVAQVLANAQAAAESATLSQSWAVGNTGTRDGENTNNAQYWSQQAAQSAQEAVGFRTMQGGAVIPVDGDIDLTQPYPTKTGASVSIASARNRIDSVTVNGFTTQTGSGDPSPINIRPIENAGADGTTFVDVNGQQTQISLQAPLHDGDTLETNVQSEYDAVRIFNGSESDWKEFFSTKQGLFGIKMTDANAQLCASSRYAKASNPSIYTDGFCGIDNNLNFWVVDRRFSSIEDFKADLVKNNLPVFYKSTSGGTSLNIKREKHVKKTLVLTGNESTQDDPGWISGVIAVLQKLTDAVQVDGYVTVANITCSHLKVDTPNDIAINGHVACGQGAGSKLFLYFGSQYNTTELAKAYLAQQYAAGTPVTVEYDLASPEVYADTPVEINNPQGTYTVSGESGTTCQVYMEPLQNGGVANAVENSLTLQDAEGETQLTYDGSAASVLELTKTIVGLANVDNTPDAQKNVKGLAVEQTDVITGLPTGLYYYKANTPGAPDTQDGLLLALVYATFGAQLAFPTDGGIYFRWAVSNFSEWARLDQ